MQGEVASAKRKALRLSLYFEVLANCFKYLALRVAARTFLTVLRPPVNVALLSSSAVITQTTVFFRSTVASAVHNGSLNIPPSLAANEVAFSF